MTKRSRSARHNNGQREGMDWHDALRPSFRAQLFGAVRLSEKATSPGIKLTKLRELVGREFGTLTQMFRELEPMVEDGLIYSDNALGDNTYRTNLSIEEYCARTGESLLSFYLHPEADDATRARWARMSVEQSMKSTTKYCIRNEADARCTQCRSWAPKRKRICPVYKGYQDY